MKAITKTISVKNFTDLNIDKKIFLDESFQRGTDEKSSWEDTNKKEFIDSTLLGSAVNPIVLVDVKAALEYNLQTKSSPDSVLYFQNLLDKEFEYLSIDGNNRSITYKDFRNELFKALHKSYLYDRGSSEIKKDFDKYSTMPSVLQEKYNDTQIDLKVFTEITSAQCRDVFRNLNKGMPLNHQQYRHSYPSDFAQYVRDNRKKYLTALSKFLGNKDIQELKTYFLNAKDPTDAAVAKTIASIGSLNAFSFRTYKYKTKNFKVSSTNPPAKKPPIRALLTLFFFEKTSNI